MEYKLYNMNYFDKNKFYLFLVRNLKILRRDCIIRDINHL